MRALRPIFFGITTFFLLLSCAGNDSGTLQGPAEPGSDSQLVRELSADYGIVWELFEYEISGEPVDISEMSPFYLIFETEQLNGRDGCNWYGGDYELRNDSLIVAGIAATEMACYVPFVPNQVLLGAHRIELEGDRLTLENKSRKLVFLSRYGEDIAASPLLDTSWRLTASNAAEFPLLQQLDLLPTLKFGDDRRFAVEWYCDDRNIMGCNLRQGLFGLGNDGAILFLGWGGSYARPQDLPAAEDDLFVEKLLASSVYTIADDTVTFYNRDAALFFAFSGR